MKTIITAASFGIGLLLGVIVFAFAPLWCVAPLALGIVVVAMLGRR
jgi:hypothetical protein